MDEKSTVENKAPKTHKNVFWVALVLGLLFLLMGLAAGVFHFFLMLIIWGVVLFFLKKWAFLGTFSFSMSLVIVFLVVITIVSFVILPASDGSSPSGSSGSSKTSAITECEAVNLGKKTEERVSVEIVSIEDVLDDQTRPSYSLAELYDLQYGYNAQETTDGYYVNYELCHGDKTISFADLEAETWNYKENTRPEGVGSSSGNYTHFPTEEEDGTITNDIEEPGTYQLYAYVSYNGTKWYIAQKHEFEVK